jgi:capsular polysaccharide biosynthesis protein
VLAVGDLSAEIHYHWLLEQLPRLGLALEGLDPSERAELHVWHNGGDDPQRRSVLTELLGVDPARLVDARRHPHVRAERLLVPPFSGHFGWPSAQAQRWLRQRFLPGETGSARRRRLWLGRSPSARRPVWGEAALLEHLELEGMPLEAVDLGKLSLREQAATLAEAELVVAPHGGALANLVFAQQGTRVLELHQPRYAPPYFHGIVQALELRYARCVQPAEPPCLYRELVFEGPLVEPIQLDPYRCAKAMSALLSTP